MSVRSSVRAIGFVLILVGMVYLPLSTLGNAPGVPAVTAHEPAYRELGLAPRSIRLSASGYMLDFRYQVLVPERAAGLINKKTEPYLITEADGIRLAVPAPPKIGPLRHTGNHMVEGKTYFIIFANPARKVQRGDRVTVVLGEHRIEHLIVQ